LAMSLQTPEKIRTLQKKLYLKAKEEPGPRRSPELTRLCSPELTHP